MWVRHMNKIYSLLRSVHNPWEKIDTCINNSNSREALICDLLKVQKDARRTVREREEG